MKSFYVFAWANICLCYYFHFGRWLDGHILQSWAKQHEDSTMVNMKNRTLIKKIWQFRESGFSSNSPKKKKKVDSQANLYELPLVCANIVTKCGRDLFALKRRYKIFKTNPFTTNKAMLYSRKKKEKKNSPKKIKRCCKKQRCKTKTKTNKIIWIYISPSSNFWMRESHNFFFQPNFSHLFQIPIV